MLVKATRQGYFGNQRRKEGEVFEVPEGTKGSWMQPVEKPTKPASSKSGKKGEKGKQEDFSQSE